MTGELNLKERRLAVGKTQADVGEAVGVDTNTVARWERGELGMSPAMRDRVDAALRQWDRAAAPPPAKPLASIAARDPVLQDISRGLDGHLDTRVFQRCVVDMLRSVYPSITLGMGGADGGFDGMVPGGAGFPPIPAIITTSRTKALANFNENMQQVQASEPNVREAIFVCARPLTPKQRDNLKAAAAKIGVRLCLLHDRDDLAMRLRERPDLSKDLLGIAGAPTALTATPAGFRGDTLMRGRNADLEWLVRQAGDCLLVGQPGMGKTCLLATLARQGESLFLSGENSELVAGDIRARKPLAIVVDDAHTETGRRRLRMLQDVRHVTDDDFRIIASSWPGNFADAVQTDLGIHSGAIRELSRFDADVVVEIIKDICGNRLQDDWIRAIRRQADGRPGLAVALTIACLEGDVQQALTGKVLCKRLLSQINAQTGAKPRDMLAAIALGGQVGMDMRIVAEVMGVQSPLDMLADLQSAGVVETVRRAPYASDDEAVTRFAVMPQGMRSELLNASLPLWSSMGWLDRLMERIQNRQCRKEALLTLIGAVWRGADVPQLREWIETQRDDDLWVEYAYVNEDAAIWAYHERRDLMHKLAGALLFRSPNRAFGLLLDRLAKHPGDGADGVSGLRPKRDTILHHVREWSGGGPSDVRMRTLKAQVGRRQRIMDEAERWLKGRQNSRLPAIACMCIALNPTFEGEGADPGMGRGYTLVNGVLPDDILEQLAKMWPQLQGALRECPPEGLNAWRLLFALVHEWTHPNLYSPPRCEASSVRRDTIVRMLRDLADLSRLMPGVQARLGEMAARVDVELDVQVRRELSVLHPSPPLKHVSTSKHLKDTYAAAMALGREWAERPVRELAVMLRDVAEDAKFAHNRLDTVGEFCGAAAEAMESGHIAAVEVLLTERCGAAAVHPFLRRGVKNQEAGWQGVLASCLNDAAYSIMAVETVFRDRGADAEMGDNALAKLVGMPHVGEVLALRKHLPSHRVLEILHMADGGDEQGVKLARQVALGHWQATDNKGEAMRDDVRPAWRKAIMGMVELPFSVQGGDGYWLGEILAQDGVLALGWFEGALAEEQDHINKDDVAKKAVGAMSKDQKKSLLDMANKIGVTPITYFFALEWVPACIGDDNDLYRHLLACPNLKEVHGLPLAGVFSEQWRRKALAALDSGRDEQFIAFWGEDDGKGARIIAGISDMWREKRQKFESLRVDPDPRLRKVGEIGANRMRQREQGAIQDEELERRRG